MSVCPCAVWEPKHHILIADWLHFPFTETKWWLIFWDNFSVMGFRTSKQHIIPSILHTMSYIFSCSLLQGRMHAHAMLKYMYI